MNKFILFLIVLCALPISTALQSGDDYEITKINCYGVAKVNVAGDRDIIDYDIKNCNYKGERIWECACNGETPIVIRTDRLVNHEYYIKIGYFYTPEMSKSYEKIDKFNLNFTFDENYDKDVKPIIDIPIGGVAGVVLVVIIIVGIIVYIGYKKLRKEFDKEENSI